MFLQCLSVMHPWIFAAFSSTTFPTSSRLYEDVNCHGWWAIRAQGWWLSQDSDASWWDSVDSGPRCVWEERKFSDKTPKLAKLFHSSLNVLICLVHLCSHMLRLGGPMVGAAARCTYTDPVSGAFTCICVCLCVGVSSRKCSSSSRKRLCWIWTVWIRTSRPDWESSSTWAPTSTRRWRHSLRRCPSDRR